MELAVETSAVLQMMQSVCKMHIRTIMDAIDKNLRKILGSCTYTRQRRKAFYLFLQVIYMNITNELPLESYDGTRTKFEDEKITKHITHFLRSYRSVGVMPDMLPDHL